MCKNVSSGTGTYAALVQFHSEIPVETAMSRVIASPQVLSAQTLRTLAGTDGGRSHCLKIRTNSSLSLNYDKTDEWILLSCLIMTYCINANISD